MKRMSVITIASVFSITAAVWFLASSVLAAAPLKDFRDQPEWAKPDNLLAQRVNPAEKVTVQVHLELRNTVDAEAELLEISNPDSPRYGQFLTDEEFMAKYAPTDDQVEAVVKHLKASGLKITEIAENRGYVTATGNVGSAERAFGTQLGMYRVGTGTRRAPTDRLNLPATLPPIAAVLGLVPTAYKPLHHRADRLTDQAAANLQRPVPVSPGDVRAALLQAATPQADYLVCVDRRLFGQIPYLQNGQPIGNFLAPVSPLAVATVPPCGTIPDDLRLAYGVTDDHDGHGQSVAIIDAYLSPTLLQDTQTYVANHDPKHPFKAAQFSAQWGPGTPDPAPDPTAVMNWYAEQALDIQAVHAMAPGAKIVYVGAQTPNDVDLIAAVNLVVTKRLATIISNSYGSVEAFGGFDVAAWHNLATQAGLKGIGIYVSSGDYGDISAYGFLSTMWPASLDNVTAVGGTSLGLGLNGKRIFESGWQTFGSFYYDPANPLMDTAYPYVPIWSTPFPGFFVFASGGGFSTLQAQPSYQARVIPAVMAGINGSLARGVPDVSMVADPYTGFLIGFTSWGFYNEFQYGGTSLSCPLFAGMMAVAQERSGKKFGFANPLIYSKNAKAAFNDIVPQTPKLFFAKDYSLYLWDPISSSVVVGTIPLALTVDFVATSDLKGNAIPIPVYHTAVGWDGVTGLGSPSNNFFKTIK